MLKDILANRLVKHAFNRHVPGERQNVFLFATPRGGSTWVMELIWSQPGFKVCNEPLDLRNPLVRRHLGIENWEELYSQGAEKQLERYFDSYANGRLHIVEPLPFRAKYHRYRTDRIVFKLLHGCEDRIEWLSQRYDARPLLLLRHPLPVSLSRKVLPRLESFLRSDYRRHFSQEELRLANSLVEKGSPFQKAVLDWCLQNAVPLRLATPGMTIVTYEQLVLEPESVIPVLAERLDLPEPERMLERISDASSVTHQSDSATKRLLEASERGKQREFLVSKWLGRVTPERQVEAQEILDGFAIDAYSATGPMPHERLLLDKTGAGRGSLDPLPAQSTQFVS